MMVDLKTRWRKKKNKMAGGIESRRHKLLDNSTSTQHETVRGHDETAATQTLIWIRGLWLSDSSACSGEVRVKHQTQPTFLNQIISTQNLNFNTAKPRSIQSMNHFRIRQKARRLTMRARAFLETRISWSISLRCSMSRVRS